MPKVTLKVPKLSGFDKSFQNLLTTKCGTLTPILVDEVIPNTKVHLKTAINACLPPLASDTFMRCNLKLEAFFVPHRLLYGGFVSWLTGEQSYDDTSGDWYSASLPKLTVFSTDAADYLGAGTLSDYLGIRSFSLEQGQTQASFNPFLHLCYHRIYDDWYRNPLVQVPVFSRAAENDSSTSIWAVPFSSYTSGVILRLTDQFPDGATLGDLRQRNFGFDPFTTALPTPQFGRGDSFGVDLYVNPDTSKSYLSISALRAANSLQQFAERHSLAGTRYQDYVKANYGADLSAGVAQRSLLLGSAEVPVYSKGVYANSNFVEGTTGPSYNNPFFESAGAKYGSAVCTGEVELINDFTANECGYIMVIASLVPKVTYSRGIDPMLLRYMNQSGAVQEYDALRTDMANPLLQNVGNEAIPRCVLTGSEISSSQLVSIFGYQQRFGFWKTKFDELHGLMRDGESLSSFALQRTVTGQPTISTRFLQIPTDFLDQVSAVPETMSQFGCWIDCYHDYKVAMPLAEYSIPSLQDPAYEHGEDVTVEVGGSRL